MIFVRSLQKVRVFKYYDVCICVLTITGYPTNTIQLVFLITQVRCTVRFKINVMRDAMEQKFLQFILEFQD